MAAQGENPAAAAHRIARNIDPPVIQNENQAHQHREEVVAPQNIMAPPVLELMQGLTDLLRLLRDQLVLAPPQPQPQVPPQPQAPQDQQPIPPPGHNLAPAEGPDWRTLMRALHTSPPTQPLFHGFDHESPKRFLHRSEAHFEEMDLPRDQFTSSIGNGLRGDAEKWWRAYSTMDIVWRRFQKIFLLRFNSVAVLSKVQAQLYARRQEEKEPVASFLQEKIQIFERIHPHEPEEGKIATLLELLKPSLRSLVRASRPATVEQMLTFAMGAEQDEAERPTPRPTRKEGAKPTLASPAQPSPSPPKCWYCPDHHFNRDCPVLRAKRETPQIRPENWRVAAVPTGPVAQPSQ